MKDSVISVSNFSKRYGEFVAVDDASFNVQRGEIFGLLGPNGAGKTTILESLEGLRTPDSGTLQILDLDPTTQTHKLQNVIGVQLQTSGLPDSIRVDEAMDFFSAYHNVSPRYDLLERLGLKEKLAVQYQQLSTGQQRRLALALAVAHKPEVLFLDEPTAGLDVASRVELHDMMRELRNNGTTIILATHDMAEAEEMADRVAILLRGKIETIGTPMELTASGSDFIKVSVQSKQNSLSKVGKDIPGVESWHEKDNYYIFFSSDIGQTVSAIINMLQSNNDDLIDLRVERPSLEDRFLEITSN
ncbi:MAG: ABC transporter ATP-binding protein [bacterium]|nr:ABC transporter ATP-binding protein [bacterium]